MHVPLEKETINDALLLSHLRPPDVMPLPR